MPIRLLIFAEEGAVLGVGADAARTGIRSGRLEPIDFSRLCVDAADVVGREVGEVHVVVRVGIVHMSQGCRAAYRAA